MIQDNVETLRSRHSNLEKRLKKENSYSYPNHVLVSDIKRQKLRIKDKLAYLMTS